MRRLAAIAARLIRNGWFVFAVVLIVHGLACRGGPILAGDTQVFTLMADRIAAEGWAGVFSAEFLLSPKWTRLLYVGVLMSARAVAGMQWPWVMLALNLLCDALLAVLIVRLVLRRTGSSLAGWGALALFTGAFEIVFWVRYVLSDTLFALMAFIPFYLLAGAFGDEDLLPRRAAALSAAAAVASIFVRPIGLPLLLLTGIGIVWLFELKKNRSGSHVRKWLGVGLLVAALLGVIVHAAVMRDPALWPATALKRQVTVMAGRASTGEVVISRPATFHDRPESLPDYIALDLARFVRFFQYVAEGYSRGHNLVNAGYFTPLYLLALVAILRARRERADLRAMIWYAALTIALFAWFHAITILDFNWRYRLPVMSHLIVLAAVGLDQAAQPARGRRAAAEPAKMRNG